MKRQFFFLCAIAVLATEAIAEPIAIEAFGADDFPITGTETVQRQGVSVVVYDLDATDKALAEAVGELPADPEQAQKLARERSQSAAAKQAMKKAFEGLAKAHRYGIRRYPAIVFDHGKAVVYDGDLNQALARYRIRRTANP